ncbi:unnamed protein product [Lactuca saligna]|uniref:Protein EXECUTER n=1 Tax=Lactuca saligna TaxID=75948 RepID=A0AA36EQP4_LACSI|nr:unnamed protein product [Lactuca saligna]
MASISPPAFPSSTRNFDPTPHKLSYATPKSNTTSHLNHRSTYSSTLFSQSLSIGFHSNTICRCQKNNDEGNPGDNESPRRWDSAFHDYFKNVIKWFDDYMDGYHYHINQPENDKGKTDDSGGGAVIVGDGGGDEDWDWERWKKHFSEVDKQEVIVSILENQLHLAVVKEDYEEAARIKVAIAAAATNDTVGRVMSQLNKAIKEERFKDAAFVRDHASAGLVGWWTGFSDDSQDPYGRIIQISAEYGRYLARSYTPRQLAEAADGVPLFEVFITMNEKGEYKHQIVYLKQSENSRNFSIDSATSSSLINTLNSLDSMDEESDLSANDNEDTNAGFENILRDIIPGAKDVKIKVMNLTPLGKIDMSLISKVVEQIMEEEDEEVEEERESDTELDSDTEQYEIDFDVGITIVDNEDKENPQDSLGNNGGIEGSKSQSTDNVILDLASSIVRGEIPMKVLDNVDELINLTINQGQNRQSLSGSTTFNRIELPLTGDPLNGIYVGHGYYTYEIVQLKRKFGQWKEDENKEFTNLEFYEYVEAVKITGDPHVPAGQVAFRAKVGTKYQLPHGGIIPEEFGVIARYRGQGRLAEAGFQNPRWVDGELVILDGKRNNGGSVVVFVYRAPENHSGLFFKQLRL